MSKSISRNLIAWPLLASLALLSACSDNDPANVSFQERDTTAVEANIIPNPDLGESDTEWTGWDAVLFPDQGVLAEFALAPTLGQGGKSLKTSVQVVEVESAPDDVYVGISSLRVKPGQGYGVAAYVQGPRCGLTRFIVNPEGNTDPDFYLANQNIFLTGEPQLVEFYFQVPEDVTTVDMPVQMGFADNIGGEFYIDRLVAIPLSRVPSAQENNVAYNSDFEESNTDINVSSPIGPSWGQSGTGATFTLDTTVSQSGNNSVRIEFSDSVGSGNPWDIEAGSINVPVTSGWTYVFSAWIKGEEGAKVNFLVQNPTQYNVYGEQVIDEITDEWQEVRFEALITGTERVRLYAQYNFPENSGKTIYIDNIRLIPPDTCPYAPITPDMVSDNELLFEYDHATNGSLEQKDVPDFLGWTTETGNGAAATFDMQIVPDKFNRILVNKGDQSLRTGIVTATANPADIQAGPADLYVTPGKTYIYSGFARGPVETTAQFTTVLPDAPSSTLESTTFVFNNIWEQITFDFTVPGDAPVLSEEELEEAGLSKDAVVTRLNMVVNMSYPENVGKYIFLDDFTLLPTAVVNGDLEDAAQPEGWITEAPAGIATIAMETADTHSGENALRVSFTRDAAKLIDESDPESSFLIALDDVQAGIENIPVEGGRKYFVSARFKGDAGTRVKLLVGAVDGSKEFASAAGTDTDEDGTLDGVVLNGGWQEITFTANVPEGVEEVNLIAQMGYPQNALRTIRLDTFRLVSQIPPPKRAKATNLISNAGFETGVATGWSGSDATIAVVESSEGVYSGRYALYVSERQQPWGSAQYDLGDSALTIGDTYLMSAWVKVDGTQPDLMKLTLRVDYVEGGTDYLPVADSGVADTLNWTKLSSVFTFTPKPENAGKTVASLKPYIEAGDQETNYFIDDLVITKVYNVNGGFETGNNSGWNASGATVSVVNNEARSGTHSARVTNRNDGWHSVQYDMRDIGLQSGHTYLLSAWVKTDEAENIKMTIEYVDGSESPQYRTIAQSSNALDWVQLSNTFTFQPVGDVSTLKVYFETDGQGEEGGPKTYTSYNVDDLIITEVAPPANIITNGDFERNNTDGWVSGGSGSAMLSIERWPAGGAHSGFFGLHIANRTQSYDSAQYPLLDLGLETNTSYKASVWVKVASETPASDEIKLTLLLNDGRDNPYITVAAGMVSSDGWTKLEGIFDFAPIGDVSDLRLYIEATQAATSYFIDDLVVARNYAFNGRLEESATDYPGWSQAGATLLLDSDTKHSGARSLFVTGRTALWNSAQYDLRSSGMVPGKTYEISAWVKIGGDTPSIIKMTMESAITGNNDSVYTQLDQSRETADWVKLSRIYTFGFDEMPAVFKVYFEADEQDEGGNPPSAFSSYYVDSLVITEVDEVYTH